MEITFKNYKWDIPNCDYLIKSYRRVTQPSCPICNELNYSKEDDLIIDGYIEWDGKPQLCFHCKVCGEKVRYTMYEDEIKKEFNLEEWKERVGLLMFLNKDYYDDYRI